MTNHKTPGNERALQRLLQRGFEALSRGQLDAAGECCQQALQIQPDLVQAHFLVGLVALEAKDRRTAFSAFQSVVALDRDHAAAWAQLARLYMTEGQVNRADAALRETLRIRPDDPLVLDLIGTTLSLMGEHGTAQVFFGRANTRRPHFPPFMQNLANNLVYHGDTEAADAIFREITRLQPDSPQAHWALASSIRASDTRHIEEMEALLARGGRDDRSRSFYLYAIGKEWEDLQEWQRAFDAFSRGAAARRATVEYDEQAEIAMFDYLETHYTRKWFDGLPEGNPDPSPIFVLGQPRTGTTLVERIISSHSQVHSAGELQQLGLALRRLSHYHDPRRFSAELFAAARELDPAKVGGMYLTTSGRMRGATPRFVDKLPQNYLMIPLILKALPNARIVHLVRDPMDACFASFKQLFADTTRRRWRVTTPATAASWMYGANDSPGASSISATRRSPATWSRMPAPWSPTWTCPGKKPVSPSTGRRAPYPPPARRRCGNPPTPALSAAGDGTLTSFNRCGRPCWRPVSMCISHSRRPGKNYPIGVYY